MGYSDNWLDDLPLRWPVDTGDGLDMDEEQLEQYLYLNERLAATYEHFS